jgi:hypothetical protein
MKLIFSALLTSLLISQNLAAREIILIEHLDNSEVAKIVKNILITKFQMPDQLIQISAQENTCSEHTEAILHLCILKNGELEIKKINRYVLKTAFNIFLDKRSI